MKEKIRKECYRRVRVILKTELNSANRSPSINTLAIPVVTYSFHIINRNFSDIKKMEKKVQYSRKRYKRIFTTNPYKAKSNKNPDNCTNKHSTYSEKSVVTLNQ